MMMYSSISVLRGCSGILFSTRVLPSRVLVNSLYLSQQQSRLLATQEPSLQEVSSESKRVRKRTRNQGPKRTPRGLFSEEMTEERLAKIREKKERNRTREDRIKLQSFDEWYGTLKELLKKHKKHRLSSLELLLEKVETERHIKRSIVIFQKFQELAITVEDRAANLFLEKLCHFNKHNTAFRYLTDYHFFRLFPDFEHCYHLLVHFYVKRKYEHASRLSKVLRKRFGDDERLLLADIKGGAQNGAVKEAYEALLEARNKNVKIPASYYKTFLRAAIKGKPEVFDFFFTVYPLENKTAFEEQFLAKLAAVKAILTEDSSLALEESDKAGLDWQGLAGELIRLAKRVETKEFDEKLTKFFEQAEAKGKGLNDEQTELMLNLSQKTNKAHEAAA